MSIKSGEPPSSSPEDTVRETISCSGAPKAWRPANPFASFRHAADGITETFQHERNFRFHLLIAVLVLALGLLLHLSVLRLVAVLGSIALVLITELLNTAIECTVDLAMPNHHPLARRAKDAGAGAVLVAALFAVAVGMAIFIPALVPYLRSVLPGAWVFALMGVVLVIAVGSVLWNRRSAVSSLRSSRKIVIGVALAVWSGACTCHPGGSSSPATGLFPALPSSAGVF